MVIKERINLGIPVDKKSLEILTHLKACPVFASLPDGDLLTLSRVVRERNLKKDMTVFHEDDPYTSLQLIKKGKVKLVKIAKDGREQIMMLLGEGELLGLAAAHAEGRYIVTATAITDTEVYIIPKGYLEEIILRYPKVGLAVIKVLGERYRRAYDLVASLAFNKVHQRVASLLLLLSKELGSPHEAGAFRSVYLSRRDLAEAAGTSPETLSRVLRRFNDSNLISINRREIRLLNPKRLQELLEI